MRLFIAVDLDDAARRAAVEGLGRLRQVVARAAPRCRIKWVEADELHVTLHFLGEVDPERTDRVRRQLSDPWDLAPFPVELGGVGLFPPTGPPRVIWLAVIDREAMLARLYDVLAARLGAVGFEPERRAFRAHLTLGRVREAPGGTGAALREVVERFPGAPGARWLIDHVTLYESRLSPRGPTYTPLLVRPLDVGSR